MGDLMAIPNFVFRRMWRLARTVCNDDRVRFGFWQRGVVSHGRKNGTKIL